MRSASLMTGTTSPFGVSAAKPRCRYFFSTSASPSSELLNSGNFFSAATEASIRKASIVTLTPDFSFSLLVETRKASRSVMSASSWLVTCGIITQLRCRLAPLIFLIRPRSLRSNSLNLEKSDLRPDQAESRAVATTRRRLRGRSLGTGLAGHHGLGEALDVFLGDAALGARALDLFERNAERRRANLRTDGEACGKLPLGATVGSCAAGAAVAGAAAGAAREPGAEAAVRRRRSSSLCRCAGAARPPPEPSTIAIRSPMLTVSPTLTFSSFSTPAADDGISIEALSDSTVISDCSTLTVSPGLTSTSITATSLKSPMSGTLTSIGPADAAGAGAAGGGAATGAAAAGAEAGAVARRGRSRSPRLPAIRMTPP